MLQPTYHIPTLPPAGYNFETVAILKALVKASSALAELKGLALLIPNQSILIDTLALREAKTSSEVENIVTTHDELFRADLFPKSPRSPAAKEVALYRKALKVGFDRLRGQRLITTRTLTELFQTLKERSDGLRTTSGTALRNETTGEMVYIPPQGFSEIASYMSELEKFVNEEGLCDLHPLIKMALVHHQFESIHPYSDGNGRVGRILNILYLTKTGLLDTPILYLSRYVIRTKETYYRLLQAVRDHGSWEAWVLYMLTGVAETAQDAMRLVQGIRDQMGAVKHRMRKEVPKLYSQELLNNLFRHPYTRIEFVANDLGVVRQTATTYLNKLAAHGFVTKHSYGKNNYYINADLVSLLMEE